ncbi:MAG: hypothetical protein JWQ74_631 [Marmoricola sp.]|nr:hypothetical protein [Marmoricola sp.]
MRRITFWALSTVSAVALLFGYSTSTSGPGAPSSVQSGAVISSALDTSGSATTNSAGSDQTSSGSGSGSGSDSGSPTTATVTGSVASTRWGPVQVELVMTGTKITKVNVLQYPSGNGKDAEINSYALPILIQETLDAQSAGIDMVSGATVTSDGYLSSLQSALDQT